MYALKHLEQEGAAFIKLRYELDLQLFMPSDLMGPKYVLKRLEFLDECMIGNAKNSFNKALEHTRGEFVESANVSNENRKKSLCGSSKLFADWLAKPDTLQKLSYALVLNEDATPAEMSENVRQARERALLDYERGIMFQIGKDLWKDPRNAYKQQMKYLQHAIEKLYDMSARDYMNRVRTCFDLIKYMQPPHYKKGTAFDVSTRWEEVERKIDERIIRKAIYDGLPMLYRDHIETNHNEDYQEMEKNAFEEAIFQYEKIDKRNIAERDAEKAKIKAKNAAEKEKEAKRKSTAKESNGKSKRARFSRTNVSNANKDQKKFCGYCKDNGAPEYVYTNHNEADCFKKDSGKMKSSFANQKIEKLEKNLKEINAALKKAAKKNKKKIHSRLYDSSDSSESSDD